MAGQHEPVVVTDGQTAALCAAVLVTAVATGRSVGGGGAIDGTWGTVVGAVIAATGVGLVSWFTTARLTPPARRRTSTVLVAVGLALIGLTAVRATVEHGALREAPAGSITAWVTLVDDPQPFGGATRVIVRHEGRRVEAWLRGRAARLRAEGWNAGDRVQMSGTLSRLDPDRARRVAWQHVVGELDVDWAGDRVDGSSAHRASNRVRAAIATAATELPSPDDTLLRGLVIGDDREQPPDMLRRFRVSGLSHLTAVSGQNVAYVLAAAGPLIASFGSIRRWVVTVLLIGWFVMITRFEPSIMRAGVMAIASASATLTGRERSPLRLLWMTVIVLIVVDPLLVSSVGLWLSAGATAGVAGIGPRLEPRLGALGRFAPAVAVTLGAQVGVVLPSLVVFGRLPLSSVPANLLAVPVAGLVMLYGLPAALLAATVPPTAPVVMFPARVGVRWVDTVARLAETVEPSSAQRAIAAQVAIALGWIAGGWGRRRRRARRLLDT